MEALFKDKSCTYLSLDAPHIFNRKLSSFPLQGDAKCVSLENIHTYPVDLETSPQRDMVLVALDAEERSLHLQSTPDRT